MSDTSPEAAQEFSFLAGEAAELGVPGAAPVVRRVNGAISALRWGAEAIDAVWLHGAGLNAHTFDGAIMASGLTSLAIDLPGHGDSPWREDVDYSPDTNVDAVVSMVSALAPDASTIVGQSLGGLTAIAMAARFPGLVRSLVIVDISPGVVRGSGNQVRDFMAGPDSFTSRDDIVDRALQFGLGTSRQSLERGVFLNTRIRGDGRVVFKHHLANLEAGRAAFEADLRTLWPAAERLAVPVLLIRASRGFLTDEGVAEFLARVPGSRSIRIDAGHNIQEDAPVELAAAVLSFVEPIRRN